MLWMQTCTSYFWSLAAVTLMLKYSFRQIMLLVDKHNLCPCKFLKSPLILPFDCAYRRSNRRATQLRIHLCRRWARIRLRNTRTAPTLSAACWHPATNRITRIPEPRQLWAGCLRRRMPASTNSVEESTCPIVMPSCSFHNWDAHTRSRENPFWRRCLTVKMTRS